MLCITALQEEEAGEEAGGMPVEESRGGGGRLKAPGDCTSGKMQKEGTLSTHSRPRPRRAALSCAWRIARRHAPRGPHRNAWASLLSDYDSSGLK